MMSTRGISRAGTLAERVWVLGLPLSAMTLSEAVHETLRLARAGRPTYFVTANTHYAMLTQQVPRLRKVNERAAFLVADGAPLVWASRRPGCVPLPERVAGSDLIYGICQRAAMEGLGVYLLGGAVGVADRASRRLSELFPGLRVVGTGSPSFGEPSADEQQELLTTIRAARPDILFVALGQPKGELWIAEHCEALGVPVSVQVGAALDFVAGRVRRAPRGFRRAGMEWAYRMWLEPRRLGPRYARNALFLARMIARELVGARRSAHLAEAES